MTANSTPPSTGPLRVGLFGTGRWAREVHAPGIRAAKGLHLAGIHGRDLIQAQSLATSMQAELFASFDDMLQHVDAVSLAVPPPVQSHFATRAAKAGRHVILEKPIATDLAAADALSDAVAAEDVRSVVFFTRLFLPGVSELLARASAAHTVEGVAFFRSAALLRGSRYSDSNWRRERFGALWDAAPHALAVLLHGMGPAEAIRATNPSPTRFELELRHASGRASQAHIDLRDRTVASVDDRFSFWGSEGVFSAGPFIYDRATIFGRAARTLLHSERHDYASATLGRDIVAAIESAVASVQDNGRPQPVAAPRWSGPS